MDAADDKRGSGLATRGNCDTRRELRVLDGCLQMLEDALERNEIAISPQIAKRFAGEVTGLQVGMAITDALDLVFSHQEHFLRSQSTIQGGSPAENQMHRPRAETTAGRHVSTVTQKGSSSGSVPDSSTKVKKAESEPLTELDARSLTESIKANRQQVSLLLLEAHDRHAWKALGYPNWERYVRIEFRMSRSRSYELLDHARILGAVMSAAGLSGIPDISAHAAELIKPRLLEVLAEIDVHASGLTEELAQECVLDVIRRNSRQSQALISEDARQQSALEMVSGSYEDAGQTVSGDIHVAIDTGKLNRMIEYISSLGPPSEVARRTPNLHEIKLAALQDAVKWLAEFANVLSARSRGQGSAICTNQIGARRGGPFGGIFNELSG